MADDQLNEVGQYGTLDGRKGGALEFSGHQWLQNRPPAPQAARPPSPRIQFKPTPTAIEKNTAMIHALKSAPNVLYDRFCQFGQLGVLGWCAEFAELIDELKALGFSGNMADVTRECALQTCRDILKLQLDVQMQLIILYLSGQISRLRMFLGIEDPGDYPVPAFPLPADEEYHR